MLWNYKAGLIIALVQKCGLTYSVRFLLWIDVCMTMATSAPAAFTSFEMSEFCKHMVARGWIDIIHFTSSYGFIMRIFGKHSSRRLSRLIRLSGADK